MTREEAIQYIDGLRCEEDFPYTDAIADFIKERNEAIDMAIESLSAPSGDLVSRADAMAEFREWVKRANENGKTPTWNDAVSLIGSLPSTEYSKPLQTTLNGDLISRADAIEALMEQYYCDENDYDTAIETINGLPSADAVKVAYICDSRACNSDCELTECTHTTDIEHAKNFIRHGNRYMESADAIPTVIRAKTFMRKEDFDKWADDIKKQNKSVVCISCDAEVVSADAIHSDGVFVPNMEMPKACDYCLFHDSEWSWCKAKDKYCGDGKCPLIAVRGERREL